MNTTLIKAILVGLPVFVLLLYSARAVRRGKDFGSLLELFGASCLLVVIFTHVCEALHLLPSMGWGAKHSSGHYLDLLSSILGLTSLLLGFLIQALARKVA